jgi:hypothetical protein
MKRPLLAALMVGAVALGLSACETATPYQPLNPADVGAGGYRDARLDANHWRVNFQGNGVTSRETVERYLLYRAAELTASQGFDWFLETDQHTDRRADVYVDPYYGYGWRPYWSFRRRGLRGGFYAGFGPGWGVGPWEDPWGPGYAAEFERFDVSAEIMTGRGPKPPQALDAREVMANLGPSIARPGAPPPPQPSAPFVPNPPAPPPLPPKG